MFSGIIENIGKVKEFKKKGDCQLIIHSNFKIKEIKIGSSIACNGVCLTVHTTMKIDSFVAISFDVSKETMECSNFSDLKVGSVINLEKSLRLGDEVSGHFVFGHVDDALKLLSVNKKGESHEIILEIPRKIKKFIVKKGSITLNGISLTINKVTSKTITLNIISYTWKNTNLHLIQIGERINVEVDMLARYVTQNLK
jgi:riboflavin synthase